MYYCQIHTFPCAMNAIVAIPLGTCEEAIESETCNKKFQTSVSTLMNKMQRSTRP